MSKIKCYSVRLDSMVQISPLAYKARDFGGVEDVIPASMVFGRDYEVLKSDAYWISAWILSKKNICYSGKKEAWFDSETKAKLPTYRIEKHKPTRVKAKESNEIDDLKK